jgi:nucleoside-diphosphate-sugar epimerase
LNSRPWRIEDDLDNVLQRSMGDISRLDGEKIFVTGGTGFIGRWILELFFRAAKHGVKVEAHVLSRDPRKFAEMAPHIANSSLFRFYQGDIQDFLLPELGSCYVIHGATEASAKLNADDPGKMFDTTVLGTRHLLQQVESCAIRVLTLSSGAVYGRQPADLVGVPEDWSGGPDFTNPLNAYAEAKRSAEMLCAISVKCAGLHVSMARIFAVLGPMLPLETHFAAGNFLSDAMAGRPVVVSGDGRAVRSYVYPTDLLVQLVAILMRGKSGVAYNVGSDAAVSIKELATVISDEIGQVGVRVLGRTDAGWNPGRYVPNLNRMRNELLVDVELSLNSMIVKTAQSYGWNSKNVG